MGLYKHYKKLPYRVLNRVRHSETLEMMVLYEALYDNPKGKLWVRPESMFFESIHHQGITQPRFAPMELDIQSHTQMNSTCKKMVVDLGAKCFPSWKEDIFNERLEQFPNIYLNLAWMEGQPVGFKLGYAKSPKLFYSWLGGVLPEYRGFGIGSALLKNQQEWCRSQSYEKIQTKCINTNQNMLRLNIKNGFLIVDTQRSEEGVKLVFEKALDGDIASCQSALGK